MLLPLVERRFELGAEPGAAWAGKLLRDFGGAVYEKWTPLESDAHKAWAASGAMFLTGAASAGPKLCPAPLASCMQGAVLALRQLAILSLSADFDAGTLLGERAALASYGRQGAVSCGGSCRLLPVEDDWMAFNMARADDWDLMSALLGGEPLGDWRSLADAVKHKEAADLASSAILFGLACSPMRAAEGSSPWFSVCSSGESFVRPRSIPLVVDLSALWAGPLSTHLLSLAGARVIKVESTTRPDGARSGASAFFDLLNQGKASVALDLTTTQGKLKLEKLLRKADIVIESSRPRALQQMGIYAEKIVSETPGMTWVSITGYGRDDENAHRIAYGDDASVSAGLSALMLEHHGEVMFCADAIADPLTGAHVAFAAMAAWQAGGGYLLDISLRSVVHSCMASGLLNVLSPVKYAGGRWSFECDGERVVVQRPRVGRGSGVARPIGADTEAVLREYAI